MKRVGILTSGGDCQGLNATIRAVAKTLYNQHRHQIMWLQTGMETLCPIRSSRDYGSIS